ncbi:hypothetical protein [Polaribacter atrinae]|uniref:hypothetical protein n=1 Tax=Polaribacter atrinae TaxID=1333662 RepID=UPI0018D4AE12|nr:hypothetical protein [Polaribacter atrinae]
MLEGIRFPPVTLTFSSGNVLQTIGASGSPESFSFKMNGLVWSYCPLPIHTVIPPLGK